MREAKLLTAVAPESTESTEHASRVEVRVMLDRALSTLPEHERIAFLLHVIDGFTHAEIGEMAGIAEGSSRARVHRAKAALRAYLGAGFARDEVHVTVGTG